TLFCYTYDLGFGIHRTDRHWWIAVIETTGQYKHWRAYPADSNTIKGQGEKIERFVICADRQNTINQLTDIGIERIFQNVPANYHWEVQNQFVAIAAPHHTDPAIPDQLLTTACKLAHLLAENK
ncbi:MAG: hypothetical protein JSV03_11705, partial [Planctomycetota bacterium]